MEMAKFTVKTRLDNVIPRQDGTFNYNETIISMKWEEESGKNVQVGETGVRRGPQTFLHGEETRQGSGCSTETKVEEV